jgi:hypothetical protein
LGLKGDTGRQMVDHEQLRLAESVDLRDSPQFDEPRAARLLALRRLDAEHGAAVTAKAPAQFDLQFTYSGPRAFLCSDEKIRWLKHRAQQGLAAEVIAGRLANSVGAGPGCSPVFVGNEAIAGELGLLRFRGHVAGVEHRPGVESSKRLINLMGNGGFTLPVNQPSRAVVVAFQTWLDVSDPQVLINTLTGDIETHDHGDTFGELKKGPPSRVVIARLPGVPERPSFARQELEDAVRRIETLAETEILAAVAGIPNEPGWQATFARRLAIAEWLIKRQRRLREVLLGWGMLAS